VGEGVAVAVAVAVAVGVGVALEVEVEVALEVVGVGVGARSGAKEGPLLWVGPSQRWIWRGGGWRASRGVSRRGEGLEVGLEGARAR
jgi:hypothetical protein